MSRERVIIYGLVSVVILLYFVYITVQVSFSTKGVELMHTQQEIIALQKINMDLENHYLERASYAYINAEARKMGFQKAKIIMLGGE